MAADKPPLVAVTGVSGVGKTHIGTLLAERLGVDYADADDFHSAENVAGMRAGTPLTDELRRPWLAAVGRWLQAHDGSGGVVSCSALKRRYRDQLVSYAPRLWFVHLTAPAAVIQDRMLHRQHFMPPSLLASQLADLEPFGDDERHLVVDATMTPDQVVDTVVSAGES